MASNKVFKTTTGWEIHLFPIQVQIGDLALIKCIQLSNAGMYHKEYKLEGEDYARWGNDDEYIKHFICNADRYLGQPCNGLDASGNPIIITQTVTASSVYADDNRSVHNEADIQRIQSLQQQLDEQAAKLKTITELLFKNGSI